MEIKRIEYDPCHGYAELIDVFGNDERIANVARGSYKKGTKRTSTDEQLIRYLVRHEHNSPLEFGQLLFHVKIPIFTARQLFRHRTLSANEASLRYSEAEEEFYLPEIEQLGPQSTSNKQGRDSISGDLTQLCELMLARDAMEQSQKQAYNNYKALLEKNISRETARSVLPVSLYTEISLSWDLRNFLGFLKLRLDHHAQFEIRILAQALHDLARPHFPVVFQAWEDYIKNAHSLSALDQQLLMTVDNIKLQTPTLESAISLGMSKREYSDFCNWLETIRK